MNLASILSKEQYDAIETYFHEHYGKKAGLLRSDYKVNFDDEIANDAIVIGGEILKVCFKDNPLESTRWKQFANDLFVKNPKRLKSMLRVPMMKKNDSIVSMAIGQEEKATENIKKNDEIARYEITAYAVVKVKDKLNGKTVELMVKGNMWDTSNECIKILKGA